MQRILILLVFMSAMAAQGQVKSQVYVDGKLHDELEFRDTVQLSSYIQKIQVRWVDQGYYFSGIDSLIDGENGYKVYLHKGEDRKVRLEEYNGKKIVRHLEKQLDDFSNNGYPFASITLDSLKADDEHMSGKLRVMPGPEITYDSAFFFNPVKTNHSYIYHLLDIIPGNKFGERSYRQILKKIDRSPFLTIQRPTDLSFKNKQAKTFLDIKEEAANSFQGVLGLQQSGSQSTTVVGNIELDIQNLFRSGKQFMFSWERFSEQSQSLNVFYKHPFFLDSKISPSFSFDLLKQDTTFLTRRFGLGVHTYIAPRVEMFLSYEQTKGTLLTTDIQTLEASGLAGFTRTLYSLQLSKGDLVSLGRLTKGVVWSATTSAGNKQVDRSLEIPDTYYDSMQEKTSFYRFEGVLAYQLKAFKRQAFFHHISTGKIKNDQLLQNELYRLGGLFSLRGFNEKDIFARHYFLSRMEFRSFFEERSYAYVFYDQLIFEKRDIRDYPFGVGLGFALETSAGQFTFALAVGDSKNQSISFSTMKAHFGYISRF
ncbi:hypothetical protein [Ekhidna sp.]|uniref:hypothetical protein n=1 Tax=Ekhidna sp. TaxID=2608089 RepID=UPI003C7C9B70